jgi:hypothetical protein
MIIKNCVQNEDGSLDFDFNVNADEAAFLMDFSIKSLIHHGLIDIISSEETQEISIPPDIDLH